MGPQNESDARSEEASKDDPRLQEPTGDQGMPAEFIDTPRNEPGSQQPPDPATLDD